MLSMTLAPRVRNLDAFLAHLRPERMDVLLADASLADEVAARGSCTEEW